MAVGLPKPMIQTPPLPAFEGPPVIESLLGVQFVPVERFSAIQAGLFWNDIRSDYPTAESRPSLEPMPEDFGMKAPRIGIQLVTEPDFRYWFIDNSSTQLIQIQKDRFIRNWRRVRPNDLYPHYDTLRPKFEEDWQRFCAFLERERLGKPNVNQCEVTYVNHVPKGAGWEKFGEVDKVVTLLSPTEARTFLPPPEIVHLNCRYLMGEKQGHLQVTIQPVLRQQDATEVLQLTLRARGRPASTDVADVLAWFDMGHEWIVRGFADLTTPDMHRAWRRTA
jgi:uncharacterized protein (TIGR04255 family)